MHRALFILKKDLRRPKFSLLADLEALCRQEVKVKTEF